MARNLVSYLDADQEDFLPYMQDLMEQDLAKPSRIQEIEPKRHPRKSPVRTRIERWEDRRALKKQFDYLWEDAD